jgi:hypothetical protein
VIVELRWLIRKNKVTAEQVVELAASLPCTMAAAKKQLVNEFGPVLQFKYESIGAWHDVPVVVEYRNVEKT